MAFSAVRIMEKAPEAPSRASAPPMSRAATPVPGRWALARMVRVASATGGAGLVVHLRDEMVAGGAGAVRQPRDGDGDQQQRRQREQRVERERGGIVVRPVGQPRLGGLFDRGGDYRSASWPESCPGATTRTPSGAPRAAGRGSSPARAPGAEAGVAPGSGVGQRRGKGVQALAAGHPQARQPVGLGRTGKAGIRGRGGQVARRPGGPHHRRVIRARRIAEEVHGHAERAAQVAPRGDELVLQLCRRERGQVDVVHGVRVDLPAGER